MNEKSIEAAKHLRMIADVIEKSEDVTQEILINFETETGPTEQRGVYASHYTGMVSVSVNLRYKDGKASESFVVRPATHIDALTEKP